MLNYQVDHIGIAVPSLDSAIAEYQRLWGAQVTCRETIGSQFVELCFLKFANTKLELLQPTSPKSKLQKFLDQRGPGLHHICFAVPDIVKELARLKSLGVTLIDEVPRPGAEGTLIAFLHPKSMGGVLTELCQHQ